MYSSWTLTLNGILVVLLLLSPLGTSQTLQAQLFPIEVDLPIFRWWFVIVLLKNAKNTPTICPQFIGKAQLRCPGIGRNSDDLAVVLVRALYVGY